MHNPHARHLDTRHESRTVPGSRGTRMMHDEMNLDAWLDNGTGHGSLATMIAGACHAVLAHPLCTGDGSARDIVTRVTIDIVQDRVSHEQSWNPALKAIRDTVQFTTRVDTRGFSIARASISFYLPSQDLAMLEPELRSIEGGGRFDGAESIGLQVVLLGFVGGKHVKELVFDAETGTGTG